MFASACLVISILRSLFNRLCRMLDLNEAVWRNSAFAKKAAKLRDEIRSGIETYGIIDLGKYVLRTHLQRAWQRALTCSHGGGNSCRYSIASALGTLFML